MNFKKIFGFMFLFLILFNTCFAVKIVTQNQQQEKEVSGVTKTIVTIFVFGVMIILFVVIIAFIAIKLYKFFNSYLRDSEDFLYQMFERDLMQSINGRDGKLIWRNWKLLWLTFKRKPVYANTEKGLKFIGHYNGEFQKKENYVGLCITHKLSFFKTMEQIILIPYDLKSILKKEIVGEEYVVIIDCEGIDQIENTDYYFMPLIYDLTSKGKGFLDFADAIHKEYIEKTVYRETIKENLLLTKDLIVKSVESNPRLNFKRRSN